MTLALELVKLINLKLLPTKHVKSNLDLLFGTNYESKMFIDSAVQRYCENCICVLQFERDAKDILGIKEFVDMKRNEKLFATIDVHKGQIATLPSMTESKSFFQHYGPHSTRHYQLARIGTNILSIGGVKEQQRSKIFSEEIQVFDAARGNWESIGGKLPFDLVEFGSLVVRDKLFIIGGYSDSLVGGKKQGQFQNRTVNISNCVMSTRLEDLSKLGKLIFKSLIEIFNVRFINCISGGGWQYHASMPEAREHFSLCEIGNKIYCVGNSYCDVYQIDNDSWTTMSNVPQDLGERPGVSSVGSTIFVFGNRNKESECNQFYSVEIGMSYYYFTYLSIFQV